VRWDDKTYDKIMLSDIYFDQPLIEYYEALRAFRANPELDEPLKPFPDPVTLAYALSTFQERNDRNTIYRLKDARVAAGLSQRALAAIMGISQQSVAKIERTGSDPKLSTLRAYANAVGLQITHELTILGHFDPRWKEIEAQREAEEANCESGV
jgi:DNA-binding XRE family transcriptional regulator